MSKLSVKHFELLTQDSHSSGNYTFKRKMEKEKNSCYLVFGDKKEVCLFQKGKKY